MIRKYLARKRAEREEREWQARLAQHRAWWEVCNIIKGGDPIPFNEEDFR